MKGLTIQLTDVQWAPLAAGVLLLLLGRRLFWLFVGASGFLLGTTALSFLKGDYPSWVPLAAGLGLGLVGAVLAIFLKKLAIRLSGLVAGVVLTHQCIEWGQVDVGPFRWLVVLAGGIVGALLILLLFETALIVFSALTGAMMVSNALPLDPAYRPWVFMLGAMLGAMVQVRWMAPKPPPASGNDKT